MGMTRAQIDQAFSGDSAALRELVVILTPLVQVRVARALVRRRHSASGRDIRQELEDLSHEVLLALLAEQGQALRRWDGSRGLEFEAFVGFLSERQVASILRVARRNPWTEDPTMDERLDSSDGGTTELVIESRQLLERLLDRLTEVLSPLGLRLFELLFILQLELPEVCAETGLKRDAVYAWRSRLSRLARQLRDELATTPEAVAE